MQLDTEKRRTKIIKIKHLDADGAYLRFVLLPLGYRQEKEWSSVKKGDILRFFNGESYRIFSVRKLKINSPTADILCRMRYGIPMKGALMRWQSNAILEGSGKNSVNTEDCLWVIHENEKYEPNTV